MLTALTVQAVFADGGVEISVCIQWGLIAGLAAAIVATWVEVCKHRPVRKASDADHYIKEEDIELSVTTDRYLRTTRVKTKKAKR